MTKGGTLSAFAHLDDAPDEEITDLTDLQRARAIVGELHWLTTRTRELLKYVYATQDVGLHYRTVTGEDFGPGDSLRHPRSVKHIEVYSDASFAPSAEQYKSVQGTLVSVAGCPVMWSSSRQTLVAQSTAEAELIGMQEGHQQGEGVASLVEELLQEEVNSTLYSDSKSAISLSTTD
eukprot:s785_g28.t1